MKPLALLFDMDGVVVDNMSYHEKAWREFFLSRGLPMDAQEFFRETSGMPTREVLSYFFKRKIEPKELKEFNQEKESLYRQLYRPHLKPLPGLVEFLEKARAAGFKAGLGTGSTRDNIDFVLDNLSLRGHFEAIVGGHDVKKGKPDPETFLLLAERLGVDPSRCVVFEDSHLGVRAAAAAGMAVVGVTTSHSAEEMSPADLAIADFRGLEPESLREFIP